MIAIRISKNYIWVLLLCILSVFPSYLRIAGHNVMSMVSPLLLLIFIFFHKKRKHKFVGSRIIFLWILVMFILYCIHGEYLTGISFVCTVMLFLMTFMSYIKNYQRLIEVIDTIIYISLVICLLGISERFTGTNIFLFLNNSGEKITKNAMRLGIVRIIGFTTQTTHFAVYCSVVSFLSLYRIVSIKNINNRIKFLIIYFIQIIALAFTVSRSAILCYAIVVILFILRMGPQKIIKYFLIGMMTFSIILLLFSSTFVGQMVIMLLSQVIPRFEGLLQTGAVATAEQSHMIGDRIRLYGWVADSLKGNILLGMGEKSQFSYRYITQYGYSLTKESIEVNYLSLLYHYGVLGTVSECAVYIFYYVKTKKHVIREKSERTGFEYNYIVHLIILMILINWFAIMEGEEVYLVYSVLFSWIAYYGQLNTAERSRKHFQILA